MDGFARFGNGCWGCRERNDINDIYCGCIRTNHAIHGTTLKTSNARACGYFLEALGLAYVSAGRGIACKRFPSRPAVSRSGGLLRPASIYDRIRCANPELEKQNACLTFVKQAFLLAERTGLEPATPGVTGRYSNQLNYHS